jgi:hypothetical protein
VSELLPLSNFAGTSIFCATAKKESSWPWELAECQFQAWSFLPYGGQRAPTSRYCNTGDAQLLHEPARIVLRFLLQRIKKTANRLIQT